MDLISRQAAIDACHDYDDGKDAYAYGYVVEERLQDLPSAQPEIIRCKDCKHHWTHKCMDSMPTDLIRAVAAVRQYGVQKYKQPDNWKRVESQRYRDAAFRHFLAYLDDPDSLDESGLPHLWHLATNIAFLIALEKK